MLKHSHGKTVNGLWIGSRLGKMERQSILSYLRLGNRYLLWAYGPVKNVPDGVEMMDANQIIPEKEIVRYEEGTFNGRVFQGFSDIFRYKLLHENGGWWTDLDVTLFKPLPDCEYSLATHMKNKYVGNVMRVPKGCPIMEESYRLCKRLVGPKNRSWFLPVQIMINLMEIENVKIHTTNFGGDTDLVYMQYVTSNIPIPADLDGLHWCGSYWKKLGYDPECPVIGSVYYKLCRLYEAAKADDN